MACVECSRYVALPSRPLTAKMMLKGRPVVQFFPAVTNCLSSSALPVRALVAIYISRQASLEPDLALLSVNSFQKDLGSPDPALRALALRALSGLDLDAIAGLVALSLRRAARDGSWYVRKTAAAACARMSASEIDRETHFTPIVALLLADRSPLVVGAAAAAFADVCPAQTDLLHPVYRALCRALVDADEWGQVALLDVLMPYARSNFLDPSIAPLDADLDLLLRCTEPLLASRNPAVCWTLFVDADSVGRHGGCPLHAARRTASVAAQGDPSFAPTAQLVARAAIRRAGRRRCRRRTVAGACLSRRPD